MVIGTLASVWKDWVETFPNIKKMFFSTNGMAYIEDIYKFILEADKNAKDTFELGIQISYDGLFGEELSRGGSREVIKENFLKLNDLLNNTHLEHINITFSIHAILSLNTISYLKDWEDLRNYLFDFDDFYYSMSQTCNNARAKWESFTLQCQNAGFDSTVEDGINYITTCKKLDAIITQDKHLYKTEDWWYMNNHFQINSLGDMINRVPREIRRMGFKSLDEYVDAYINNDPRVQETKMTLYCGATLTDLKIMYDGSIMSCQNYLFDAFEKNKKKYGDSLADQMLKNAVKYNRQILNPLTMTDEDLEKHLDYLWGLNFNNAMSGMFNGICNLMFMMAQIGQIDISYLQDLNKLKRHAFILSLEENCYYILGLMTGSVLLHGASHIRYWCNGIMDEVEEFMNYYIENGEVRARR